MVGRPKVRVERLDKSVIVAATLKVGRRRIADLTMRAVSDELQVSVGAVYKHVAGRGELLALVVEEVLSQAPPMTTDCGNGWRALRAQMLGIQALIDQYPGLDEVIVAHSAGSPTANELRRQGMASLQKEGLTPEEAHKVYRVLTWLWLGSRAALQGRRRREKDIDTFAEALDILIEGLRQEITESRRNRQTWPERTGLPDRRNQ